VITGMLDHQQVKTLYEQHARVLLAYAVSLLPDRAASEDVLHQVFVKLLQGNVGINGSPVRYLYRAIRNAAFNYRRNHSREVELEADCRWLESPPGMEAVGLALESALRELPDEHRIRSVPAAVSTANAACAKSRPPCAGDEAGDRGVEMIATVTFTLQ
jgi:DNA-directed RNA polymerase specialized sigma24 family protein